MTREHKLALIVGFVLVLFVGILISDHFSKARTETAGLGQQAVAPVQPLQPPPVTIERPPSANGQAVTTVGHSTDVIFMGTRDGGQPAGSGTDATVTGVADDIVGTLSPDLGNDSPLTPSSDQSKKPEAEIESVARHEVKNGETMFAIAKKHYGSGALWKELAAFNKGRVNADGSVRAGVSLMIPPKSVLTGKPEPIPTGTPSPSKLKPTAVAADTAKTYVVKKNDTLMDISLRLLGTTKRWREIVDANKSLLGKDQGLKIGMTLTIPQE